MVFDDEALGVLKNVRDSDNTDELLGSAPEMDRRQTLAEMYPLNQPLPGDPRDEDGGDPSLDIEPGDTDDPNDPDRNMMVSLPGQQLGSELKTRPNRPDMANGSTPPVGPPPEIRPVRLPSYEPAPPPRDDRQPPARAQTEEAPKERGFDWGRALTAFGGGDVGAYDARRRDERDAPFKRKQAEQEHAMRQADLDDRMGDRKAKRQELLDAMNPNSEGSKSAQADHARLNAMRAELLATSNPRLAELFRNAATGAAGKSRMQLLQSEKANSTLMGDFGKMVDRAVREKMMSSREADTTADNTRADKQTAANVRKIDADIARPRGTGKAPTALQIKMPNATTVDTYNKRTVAMREIDDMLKLLPGVTYTGKGAEGMNGLFSSMPDSLDLRSDTDRKFASLVGKMRAKERHDIYGAAISKFDSKDAAQWLASLGENKKTIKNNLETLRQAMQELHSETKATYPKLAGDTIKDEAPAAGSGDAAKAQAWLKENPDNPKAAAVRAKLKAMGAP